MIEDASILVTGGTGAFGTAFARHLLTLPRPPKRLVVYSRGEYRQFLMSQELKSIDYTGCTRFLIGDIRDKERLQQIVTGFDIDTVIHAAALKRIEVGQYNPIEMKKTISTVRRISLRQREIVLSKKWYFYPLTRHLSQS